MHPDSIPLSGSPYDLFTASRTIPNSLIRRHYHTPLPILETGYDDATPVLIWGFDVVRAARRLELAAVPVEPFSGTAEEALALAVSLEDRCDGFGAAERAAVYRKAVSDGLGRDAIERIGLLVASDGSFAATAERFAALSVVLQSACDRGLIDLKTAESASGLPDAELETVMKSDRYIGLSHSLRRKVVRLLAEIGVREPARLPEIIEQAFNDPSPEGYLSRIRYPELSRMEGEFERVRRAVQQRTGARLSAPAYFEGEEFRLEIAFRSCDELARKTAALAAAEEYCDELFALLR